jgi:hypothetical protein
MVLFVLLNRTFNPYMAASSRIIISAMTGA